MSLEIVTIPCLSDNYAFVARDAATGTVALVDAPEATPIAEALTARGWGLDLILLTHHHGDHIDGVAELVSRFGAKVAGAKVDQHRLPPLDMALAEDGPVSIGSQTGTTIDVSGHTIGHVAFHFPDAGVAFTADSLMALGCGRVFEGTMPQMLASLQKLAALPLDTLICSGHEYTAANAKFAMTVEPQNRALQDRVSTILTARDDGRPTVPSTLADELATNPFLRADSAEIRATVGLADASDEDVFAEVRRRKDAF